MFGREHNQAGILLEPSPSYAIDVDNLDQVIDLRNKLWYVDGFGLTLWPLSSFFK